MNNKTASLIVSLLAGMLFGLGLVISGMTNPEKVVGFLDIAGAWDASLLFVLGGAVGVTVLTFHFITRRKAPLLTDRFHFSQLKKIDSKLLVGSLLFGIGWGVSGYCPGPAIAALAEPNWETWVFLPSMVLGLIVQQVVSRRKLSGD
jgi:uncharacterized membrane protein YedE/YeeE